MRSVLLRSLAVIGVGGLALAAVLYVASTVDARPPAVTEVRLTQPLTDDADRALITTSIEVVFSEPIEVDGAADAVTLEPAVEGAVSLSGSTLIFTPHDPLDLETAYVMTVGTGIRDLAGNLMTELPPAFAFETAGRPALVEAAPADGTEDVPLEEPIALTFSTLMDTTSVESELRLRPAFAHELRWSGALLEIVPTEPLRPGLEYEVTVQADAADAAGVALSEPISIRFRTIAPGLAATTLVPADDVAGVSPTSPIAVIFDRPIDPGSANGDLLSITPEVAGSLEVVALPGDPESDDGAGSILRFTPSGPLPSNTTFAVELAPGVATSEGAGLAGPLRWTFTTGAPLNVVSNRITFLSDRSGVANVWSVNPDGTAPRQLTVELLPVLDYAIAPDGSSMVVADGRHLIFSRADGGERRVLTQDGLLEFDPTYAPNGQRVAFGRADAVTGDGLGLWEWEIGAGEATPIELPDEVGGGPSASGDDDIADLRAPRYAPDGQALAFVDLAGSVGLLELPAERLTRVGFVAAAAPIWLPDSAALMLNGTEGEATDELRFEAPVEPLEPGSGDAVFRLSRSATEVDETDLGRGSAVVAIAADGSIAYVDRLGALRVATRIDRLPDAPLLDGEAVSGAAFAPGEEAMVVIVGDAAEGGRVELLELQSGRRTPLAQTGSRPRWLP